MQALPRSSAQDVVYRFLERVTEASRRPLTEQDLTASAVVFSPHQDDETLGCGGTLVLKAALGAEVRVVFMTDGRTSHGKFLPVEELIEARRKEALEACSVLGVASDRVQFLGLPDSRLHEHHEAAASSVREILRESRPAQVYVPYRLDVLSDHLATRSIVRSAMQGVLQGRAGPFDVLEYPIWFWRHWPMTTVRVERRLKLPGVLMASMRAWFSRWKDLKAFVNVEKALDRKKKALERHKTQMVRPKEQPDWPVLADVENGQWLACFFAAREYFHRYGFGDPGRQPLTR